MGKKKKKKKNLKSDHYTMMPRLPQSKFLDKWGWNPRRTLCTAIVTSADGWCVVGVHREIIAHTGALPRERYAQRMLRSNTFSIGKQRIGGCLSRVGGTSKGSSTSYIDDVVGTISVIKGGSTFNATRVRYEQGGLRKLGRRYVS